MYREVFGLNEDEETFYLYYQLLIENTDRLIGQLLENLKEQGRKKIQSLCLPLITEKWLEVIN